MPLKPSSQGAAPLGSQAGQRYFATVYDQHKSARFPNGRPWWGSRELAANKGQLDGFCTTLSCGEFVFSLTDDRGFPVQSEEDRLASLASAWSAPWLPPQNGGKRSYYEINYRLMRVQLRYDILLRDLTDARLRYYEAANKIALEKGWPEVEIGSVPRFAIRVSIGDLKPEEDPRLPQAAQAGDPWLLGASQEVNEELAQVLGLSRRGLVRPVAAPAPVATPDQVLTMTPQQVQQMIADAIATHEAAKKDAGRQRIAKARAARGKKDRTSALPPAA